MCTRGREKEQPQTPPAKKRRGWGLAQTSQIKRASDREKCWKNQENGAANSSSQQWVAVWRRRRKRPGRHFGNKKNRPNQIRSKELINKGGALGSKKPTPIDRQPPKLPLNDHWKNKKSSNRKNSRIIVQGGLKKRYHEKLQKKEKSKREKTTTKNMKTTQSPPSKVGGEGSYDQGGILWGLGAQTM